MSTESGKAMDEARIRGLIEDRARAIRAKASVGVASANAPDVLTFDVINPLQNRGSDGIKERTEAWFASYDGPIGYEVRDLSITAGDDVAFCHFLYRVSGTTTDGRRVDMWVRATVCYRRLNGQWLVVHEHDSVPFDPQSGKASLDLKP